MREKLSKLFENPWVLIGLVILIGATYRLLANFWTPLMPKVNGAYYLVQARSVAEIGSLTFADTPILFFLQGYITKFFSWIFQIEISSVVVFVSKIFDSIVPALISIPVFFIAADITKNKWNAFVVTLFSVMFVSPIFMAGDFQKNSFGLLIISIMIYLFYKGYKTQKNIWFYIGFLFLGLSFITHIGAFALGLMIVSMYFLSHIVFDKIGKKRIVLLISSVILIIGFAVAGTFLARLAGKDISIIRLVSNLFSQPAILGYTLPGLSLSPFDIFTVIIMNILGITTLIVLKNSWNALESWFREFITSMAISVLMLSFPFISIAYLSRLSMMAYIPAFVCLAFLFKVLFERQKKALLIVTLILIFIPTLLIFPIVSKPSIPVASLGEFDEISEIIEDASETLIVTKHGLEWWVNWKLRTPVVQDLHLTQEIADKYETVLFLIEKKEQKTSSGIRVVTATSPPPQKRMMSPTPGFDDVMIPPGSKQIFDGKYFQVFEIPEDFKLMPMEDHLRP